MRLYCLPHAGGSANVYLAWRRFLDPSVELQPVELSGRGRRIAAPLHDGFRDVLADVAAQVTRTAVPADYALLGHSFGAIVAFELAHDLTAVGAAPRHLFVSASCAPERVGELVIPLAEGDRDLLTSLAHLGGTHEELLADDEAVGLFAPILRADLRALFDYRATRSDRLACDISIVLASNDPVATELDARLWAELTTGLAATRVIEGGHFAALEHPELIAPYVSNALLAV